jgi:mono/diheme cytochrome c family protein
VSTSRRSLLALGLGAAVALASGSALAGDSSPASAPLPAYAPSPERGYRAILEKAYIPPLLQDATFDAIWKSWPPALRAKAETATPAERRRMAFDRYGLTPREGDPSKPLQFVVDEKGFWSINCFACHTGQLEGTTIPGLPNARFAFQDLADDVLRTTTEAHDLAGTVRAAMWRTLPLGGTHGTTNAVVFGVALGAMRGPELELRRPDAKTEFVHHDLDAPPWWNVAKRPRLYVDGGIAKGHRSLMQFLLVPQNGPERLKAWEDDFKDVLAYVESLRPPRWTRPVDAALAARGKVAFERTCARCHGTYGASPTYPSLAVPLAVVGTDPLRHDAIPRAERQRFADSWLSFHRPQDVDVDPVGYVAPPLDGVWASAPYFHNGSVPTLWHVLHPAARPAAWRPRSTTGYDAERVGLDVETAPAVPEGIADPWEQRDWFDTTKPGKSAAGHPFPNALSEDERRAVLEYLKTL